MKHLKKCVRQIQSIAGIWSQFQGYPIAVAAALPFGKMALNIFKQHKLELSGCASDKAAPCSLCTGQLPCSSRE